MYCPDPFPLPSYPILQLRDLVLLTRSLTLLVLLSNSLRGRPPRLKSRNLSLVISYKLSGLGKPKVTLGPYNCTSGAPKKIILHF